MAIDLWHLTTLVGAIFGALVILGRAKISLWIKIPFAYFFISSVYFGMLQPGGDLGEMFYFLSLSSLRFAIQMLLIVGILSWRFGGVVKDIVLRLHHCVLPILIFYEFSPYIGNSHDTLAVAVCLPMLFDRRPLSVFFLLLSLGSIFYIHDGMTAQVLVALYACYYIITKLPLKYSLPLLALGSLSLFQMDLSSLSIVKSRGALWLPYLNWWATHANPFFGAGPNSFEGISSALGRELSPFYKERMWIHGDWIQILFQSGILGVVGAGIVYVRTLWRIRHENKIFLVWLGLGVGMLVYSLLQFWSFQLIAGWIILRGDNEKISKSSEAIKNSKSKNTA